MGILVRDSPGSRQRRRRATLCAASCLLVLSVLLFLSVGALLSSPAEAPQRADVVVVLGGDPGLSGRYSRGRDLLQSGYSSRFLLMSPTVQQVRDARDRFGDVDTVDSMPAPGSWGEALATRQWMRANGCRSALVVSDPPHMGRLLYAWGSVFRGTGLGYRLVATQPSWWSSWRWWRDPIASNFVRSELVKFTGYVLLYRFGFGLDTDAYGM